MKEKIVNLIENYETNSDCAELMNLLKSREKVYYDVTGPVYSESLYEIYSKRNRNWKRKNTNVTGTKNLLHTLVNLKDYVLVHLFAYNNNNYIVFTDKSISQILGFITLSGSNEGINNLYSE